MALSSHDYAQWCVYEALSQRPTGHSRPFFVPVWAHAPEEELESDRRRHDDGNRNRDLPCFIQERDDGTFPAIVFIEIDRVPQLERLVDGDDQKEEEEQQQQQTSNYRGSSDSAEEEQQPTRFLVVSTVVFAGSLFVHAMLSNDTNMKNVISFRNKPENDSSNSNQQAASGSSNQARFNVDLTQLTYEKTFTVRIPVRETLIKKSHLREVSIAFKEENQGQQRLSNTAEQLVAMEKLIATTIRSRVLWPILEHRGVVVPTLQGIGKDIQLQILEFLTIRELCTVDCVCQKLRSLVNSKELWVKKKDELEKHGVERQGFSLEHIAKHISIQQRWVDPRKECAAELNKRRQTQSEQEAAFQRYQEQQDPLRAFQPQTEPIFGPFPYQPGAQPGQRIGPMPHGEGLLVGGPQGAMPDDDLFMRGGQRQGRGRRGRGGGGGMFGGGRGGSGMFGFSGGDDFI